MLRIHHSQVNINRYQDETIENDETDLDSEAARRALDYYLNPTPPRPNLDNKIWTLHEGVSAAQAGIMPWRCCAARRPPRTKQPLTSPRA